MTKRVRADLLLIVAMATLGLAGCDHYTCSNGFNFGSSTCSNSSISNPGGSGSGGSATAALVFAVDQGTGTGGTIDGFTLDTSANTFQATPSYTAPTIPDNNGGIGMVVAQKQFLYVGLGTVEKLYGWTISSTGSLTAITGSPFPASLDFLGTAGEAAMIANPAGTMLFVSDQLQSQIYAYQIGTGGVLTAATGSPFALPVGFQPMNLATDGLGKYLYASNGNSSTHTATEVAGFVINTTTGSTALTPVPGSPFAFPMWLVKGEPTGNFLIGTSGKAAFYSGTDDDHLYVFAITQTGSSAGAITPVSGSPFLTAFSPFSIAVQSNTSGNLLYSFSINDTATGFNAAEGYTISSAGALTADTGSPFSGLTNGSWGQFDQSGAFLFDYGSFLDISTNTVVTQLSPFDVGTGGALTQPITTLTLATPGFWAVTDTP
jgi:lactonase family protein with 7-bladed beta-propeller